MTEAKLAHLNEAIAEVASRLGTKDERPGDVALARDLRQQLRNLVCACILAKSAT